MGERAAGLRHALIRAILPHVVNHLLERTTMNRTTWGRAIAIVLLIAFIGVLLYS